MAAESLTPRTYPIWFVTDEAGNKPEASNIFAVTYESMKSCNFNVRWVTPQECLQIQEKEPKMFVMDSFSGQAFRHLVSLKCRIMGPLCLYSCMRDDIVFPRRDHPVYSISMKDVVVCCTKLGPAERADIHKKVVYMCGSYSDDLTRRVTHLICDEVGSKKYHVAASFGIPILLPEWVQHTWDNRQHRLIHGRQLSYNVFRCPIFKGLTISVSQICQEDRDFIKQVVSQEGGYYSSILDMDKTTHLILVEPSGEKFKYAKEWKLFCVHEDWFYDSLEAGYCMDENLYPPESTETSETPEPESVDGNSVLEESIQIEAASSMAVQSPIIEEFPSLEILDSFSLSPLPRCDDFLDACNIYLSDFEEFHMRKLCKIINAGGGNRFHKYSDCITHVICAKKNNKLVDLIKSSSNQPHVVSFDWLLECYRQGKLIEETPFFCMEKVPLLPDNEIPTEVANVKRRRLNCGESQKPEPLCDMDDIMKQYLPD